MGFDVGSYRPISARTGGRSSIDRDEASGLRLEYARKRERDVERLLERNENGRNPV